MYKNYPIAGQS